jgi:hypothetical protein
VVLVTGDGAFGFSIAEFDTMVRHKLPVVVVILNNRNWGAVRHYQEVFSGPNRVTGTQLDNGDYHDTAASLGAFGRYVEDEKEIVPAIRAAIASGKRPASTSASTSTPSRPAKIARPGPALPTTARARARCRGNTQMRARVGAGPVRSGCPRCHVCNAREAIASKISIATSTPWLVRKRRPRAGPTLRARDAWCRGS